jgi:non-heme chloroperoxidase
MGASVTLALMDLFPHWQPDRLILVDQSPFNLCSPDWPYGAFGMTRATMDDFLDQVRTNFPNLIRDFTTQMIHHQPDDFQRLQAISFGMDPNSAAAILNDHIQQDWRDVVRRLQMPTLVVTGEYSPLKTGAYALADLCAQAQVTEIPNAAHCPFVEQPKDFVAAVNAFLQSTPA